MAASCSPPKGVSVEGYQRTAPRRKPKPPAEWWECNSGSRWCGKRHRTMVASLRHSKQLDTIERRNGRRPDWEPEKVKGGH